MRSLGLWTGVALFFVATGSCKLGGKSSSPSDRLSKAELRELFEKEGIEKLVPLTIEKEGFRAETYGLSLHDFETSENGSKSFVVQLLKDDESDLGLVAMECSVSPDNLMVGSLVHGIAKVALGDTEGIDSYKMATSEFYALGAKRGVNLSQFIYVQKTPKGNVIGALHVAVSKSATWTLLCVMDHPGYNKTFQKANDKLASTLVYNESKSSEIAGERVYLVKIGKAEIGLVQEWEHRVEKVVFEHYEMTMLGGDIKKHDTKLNSIYRATGFEDDLMVYGQSIRSLGEDTLSELELHRDEDKFTVEGEVNGKESSAEVKPKIEVKRSSELEKCYQALFENPEQKTCKHTSWEDNNGKVIFQTTTSSIEDRAKRRVRSTSLLADIVSELDEQYRMKRGEIRTKVGKMELEIELLLAD